MEDPSRHTTGDASGGLDPRSASGQPADPQAKSPDSGRWLRTSPFAIVFFIRTSIGQVRGIINLLAAFGVSLIFLRRMPRLDLVILAGGLLIVAVGVLRYWFFRFRIEADRLLVRDGVLRKTALELPFDRIQGINVERSLIDRVFGLVTVQLDTAGSDAVEARLPSVHSEVADRLRAGLGAGRGVAAAGQTGPADPSAADEGPAGSPETGRDRERLDGTRSEVLLRLNAGDMIRIGLARIEIAAVAAIFLAMWREPRELPRHLAESFGVVPALEWAEGALAAVAQGLSQATFVAGLLLAGLVAVLIIAVAAAFRRYHGFTLWREPAAYRSRAGLFSQWEVAVQFPRIQRVVLSQTPLARCFRRYRLTLYPAADDMDELVVPLLDGATAESLRGEVFGNESPRLTLLPANSAFIRVSPFYIRGLALKIATGPALALPAILFFSGVLGRALPEVSVWMLFWALAGGLVAWMHWWRLGYMHDDDGMSIRGGFVDRNVDAFLFRKAQYVTVKQSLLQRRRRLATLEIGLATETVSVPYIDHGIACQLRDYILYRVESSRRRWH